MSPFQLDGKVAIVTGSSRGIGKAIAEAMAAAGARVVVSSRNQDACEEVAAGIRKREGEGSATAIAASISSRDALEELVTKSREAFGPIDILVCNAASNPYYGPMEGISDDQFRKILDNNVISNNWLTGMVAPDMAARGGGSIIIISSIGGLRGSAVIGAYNLSKAADMQLARNLAVELGPKNIRVNCIAPGLIKTRFSQALWENPDTLRYYETTTPLRRIGDPEEIAGCAVFLASGAGSYITGQTIVVDGGVTIAGA